MTCNIYIFLGENNRTQQVYHLAKEKQKSCSVCCSSIWVYVVDYLRNHMLSTVGGRRGVVVISSVLFSPGAPDCNK